MTALVTITRPGGDWRITVSNGATLWGQYTAPTLAGAIEILRRVRRMEWDPKPRRAFFYRDRGGAPLSLRQWAELWSDDAYRFLGDDTIGSTRVVTIWNGMYPYRAEPTGPIFSSMVFRNGAPQVPGVEYEVDAWHETEAEALAWHAATVAKLREAPRRTCSTECTGGRCCEGKP